MPPDETEIKLFLPDGAAATLARHPLLQSAAVRKLRLDNTYLDTADRVLQQNGVALRLRRSGRRWLQTLKTAGHSSSGLGTRSEWETPAALKRGKPHINLASLADTPLPALLGKRGGAAALQPIFAARFTRELWTLRHGSSVIELAIDRGRIESRQTDARRSEPISEVELELKEGRVEDLVRLALRLTGRGRDALALVPIPASKAERGYRLADDGRAMPVKAAARGFVAALEAGQSAGAALRAIMAHGLSVLLANTDAMRGGRNEEYVHQGRVALRRMRSALRLLDRRHEDFPQSLADEFRWVGRLLGRARDDDVFADRTLPALMASAPPQHQEQIAGVVERARARRDGTLAVVTASLQTARYARLALRLQAWVLTTAPAGRTLGELAPKALDKAHKRLFRAAQFFAALPTERRHRVRILAKRLRYALGRLFGSAAEEGHRALHRRAVRIAGCVG